MSSLPVRRRCPEQALVGQIGPSGVLVMLVCTRQQRLKPSSRSNRCSSGHSPAGKASLARSLTSCLLP
eukprot:7689958-Pyramimonas_sp.AAC.1